MENQNCIVTFDDEKLINIKFEYIKEISKEARLYTFKRNQDETVKSLCRRIGLNIVGKNNRDSEMPDIFFTKRNNRVSDELPISELFKDEASRFHINKNIYGIFINPPEVKKIALPRSQLLVGFTIVPIVECSNCTLESCKFTWYRSKPAKPYHWTKISSNLFYVPQSEDEGCLLRLEGIPPMGGIIFGAEALSGSKVKKGHEFLFLERAITQELEGSFTCTSYNILADLYGDPDNKNRKSMFPYCPKEALRFDYRRTLLMEELIYYSSDIYCLQEVDREFFNKELSTYFNWKNYETIFNEKVGKAEGLSILINRAKFKVLSSHCIAYGKEIETNPLFQSLKDYISTHSPNLLKKLVALGTILQIVEVSTENGLHLFIANTHLYYAPGYTILRLIQSLIGIRYLEDLMKARVDPTLIWCGDFNSSPQYSTYSLLSSGHLSATHPDWTSVPECFLQGMDLTHSLQLQSAYGTPEFTNFTKDFVACLDYILVDTKHIEVCQTLPIPSKDTVSKHVALPSYLHPSDHIALVATLTLKSTN